MVAAHLDKVYQDLDDPNLVLHGDDPSPGWAFLRKVVQLPVGVPHVADASVDRFLAAVLNVPETTLRAASSPSTVSSSPARRAAAPDNETAAQDVVEHPEDTEQTAPAAEQPRPTRTGPLELQPEVLGLIRRRLAAQPQRSAREAKRLLNVWQLYQRLLDRTEPLRDDEALVTRACNLVILAELITRWPALQRRLHQPIGDRRGLQVLAAAAGDDLQWQSALTTVGLDSKSSLDAQQDQKPSPHHDPALGNLRALLNEHDGRAVADLAARLL